MRDAQRRSEGLILKSTTNPLRDQRDAHKKNAHSLLYFTSPPVKSIIVFSPSESPTRALSEHATMNVSVQVSPTHHATGIYLFLYVVRGTQPCLTYESVQNDKLFILSFAKVEPLVKHTDCIYYSYSYLILTIFICIEQICIFVKKQNLYMNKTAINDMPRCAEY